MTLKAAVSPAESLTNFRSRVNLPEASTSPVEVLLGVEEEDGAAVDEKSQLHVEVAVAVVGQVQVERAADPDDVGRVRRTKVSQSL